jgi:hypothetical protein
MPNYASSIPAAGRADGGYRAALYRDAKSRWWPCQIISGTGPYTIRIPARLHLPASQHTLSLIPAATSKASTNAVHPPGANTRLT